jgi:sugar lactone lactonase YvrE
MKRLYWPVKLSWGIGAAAVLVALSPVAVSAHPGHHDSPPDRVDLPNGWQPEGVTTDGRALYVGSLADGAIWKASTRTGSGRVLAPGVTGRVGVGIDYDEHRDLLWVAGGPTGEIRAHDADSGRVLATYTFPSASATVPRFLNDLVVTEDAVYATDSVYQELMVVPLDGEDHCHGLPAASAATTMPLTGDLEYVTGFNLNGIVWFDDELLAVQSNTGKLFRIDPETGDTDLVDLHGQTLVNGDGLELDDELLYVVRNQDNLISVVELDDDDEDGRVVDTLTSPNLDVPSTVALARDSLWAVNARFGVTVTPSTPYWLTRLDEFDD